MFKQSTLVFLLIVFHLALSNIYGQQKVEYILKIVDLENQPIPYAHISHNGQLDAISDHNGRFRIKIQSGVTYEITCVGYQKSTFTSKDVESGSTLTLRLTPDQKILDAVVITPHSLEDMIREVYNNIPNKYLSTKHLLTGELKEYYMDTTYHTNIVSDAIARVAKSSYQHKEKFGDVLLDSLSQTFDVRGQLFNKIYAGGHIPHRFDFVMRRDDFINPSNFGRYEYKYLGELNQANRTLEVIAFTPKKGSIIGGEYTGKMYLDLKEMIFVKAEYQYTSTGFLSNQHSKWADQRMFITEYTASENGKWYLHYTWDEAVAYKKNFILRQSFTTETVAADTIVGWSYMDKLHFSETLIDQEAETTSGFSENQLNDTDHLFKMGKLLSIMRKIEGSYGLLTSLTQNTPKQLDGNLNYQNQSLSFEKKFDPYIVQFGLKANVTYKLTPKSHVFYQASEGFTKKDIFKYHSLGYSYRIYFKTVRPTNLNLNLAYTYALNEFVLDKTNDVTPTYRLARYSISPSLMYEVNLSPRWKFGVGYSYLIPISQKSSFYLREKYGLFDLFSRKIKYDIDETNLSIDGIFKSDLPWIFSNHSLELRLTMMFD